jgi:DNA (cytosine-5)-methyltransferase 1
MKIISLFSGAGGLDWGFYKTFKEISLAIEINTSASLSYSFNYNAKLIKKLDEIENTFQKYILNTDIKTIDISQLKKIYGEIDGIIGGPPCQDFSILKGNNRKGIYVDRGKLYLNFLEFIKVLTPKFFVFENVEGLLNSNKGLAYKVILEDFKSLKKYKLIFTDTLNFSTLGVPQYRKRLIIIGIHKDALSNNLDFKNFIEPLKPLQYYPLTTLEAFTGKILTELENEYKEIYNSYKDIPLLNNYAFIWYNNIYKKLSGNVIEDYIFLNKTIRNLNLLDDALKLHESILQFLGYRFKPVETIKFNNEIAKESQKVIERMNHIPFGENYKFVESTPYSVKGLMSNVYKRLNPLTPAPTIIAYGGGGTWGYHYKRNRYRLTNRERSRLQTFPDTFLFKGNITEIRSQIGEAVPPLGSYILAQYIAYITNFSTYNSLFP